MRIGNISINGVVINGNVMGSNLCEKKEFDETKKVEQNRNIQKIYVDSAIGNVKFISTDSDAFTARFYGSAVVDSDVTFTVDVIKNELKVELKYKGNCINGNLKLDISIPKNEYKEIFVTTNSGNVKCPEEITADNIRIKTMSGDIDSSAIANNLYFNTMSGDVYILINAKRDTCLNISTMSGNVNAEFDNIGSVEIATNTMNGNIRNYYKKHGRHAVEGVISTMNGNIDIH